MTTNKGGAPRIYPLGKRKEMLDERLARKLHKLAKKRDMFPTRLLDEIVAQYFSNHEE